MNNIVDNTVVKMNNIVDNTVGKLLYKAIKHKYFDNTNPYSASISEIIPGFLYLSNIMLLHQKRFMNLSKIKYILSIVTESVYETIQPEINENNIILKNIPMEDIPTVEISQYFKEAHEFIEQARVKKCKVLVHCEGGISRSPTIVISYLMKYCNMSLREAMEYVSVHRPMIRPNLGFVNELRRFEGTLRSERESLLRTEREGVRLDRENLRSERDSVRLERQSLRLMDRENSLPTDSIR